MVTLAVIDIICYEGQIHVIWGHWSTNLSHMFNAYLRVHWNMKVVLNIYPIFSYRRLWAPGVRGEIEHNTAPPGLSALAADSSAVELSLHSQRHYSKATKASNPFCLALCVICPSKLIFLQSVLVIFHLTHSELPRRFSVKELLSVWLHFQESLGAPDTLYTKLSRWPAP